jgi:hypothetical protein
VFVENTKITTTYHIFHTNRDIVIVGKCTVEADNVWTVAFVKYGQFFDYLITHRRFHFEMDELQTKAHIPHETMYEYKVTFRAIIMFDGRCKTM